MSTKPASSSQQSSTTQYTPEDRETKKKLYDAYTPSIGAGDWMTDYTGERLADPNAAQTGVWSGAEGFLDSLSAYKDIPMYGETGQALQGLLSGDTGDSPITDQQVGDYYRNVIENPARKTFATDVRPAVQEAYAGPGYWSSARANEESEAAQDLGDWLGTKRSELAWNASEANRTIEEAKAGRALSAVSPAMAYGSQPTQEASAKLGALGQVYGLGSAEQQQRQAELNLAIQQFAEQYNLTNPQDLEILMALVGQPYGSSSSSGNVSGAGLGYSLLNSFAGGFGNAYGTKLGS